MREKEIMGKGRPMGEGKKKEAEDMERKEGRQEGINA
jgi:hypothetical protein